LYSGLSPRRTEVPRSITGTPSRRRPSRVAALLAAPAAAICLLSGCSAGQINQTGGMVAPVSGVNINSKNGLAALRDVQITYNSPQGYPVGATAPLSLYIANNSPAKPLVLRGVTAVSKQSGANLGTVVLTGGAADIGTIQNGASSSAAASRGASAIPSGRASAGASQATASGSAAPPAPTQSPAAAPVSLTIPANGYARLDPSHGAYLAITAITESLQPGSSAYVTFTLEGEDPLEIAVPFGIPLSPAPRLTPSGGGHAE
jgi:hypothetical protein